MPPPLSPPRTPPPEGAAVDSLLLAGPSSPQPPTTPQRAQAASPAASPLPIRLRGSRTRSPLTLSPLSLGSDSPSPTVLRRPVPYSRGLLQHRLHLHAKRHSPRPQILELPPVLQPLESPPHAGPACPYLADAAAADAAALAAPPPDRAASPAFLEPLAYASASAPASANAPASHGFAFPELQLDQLELDAARYVPSPLGDLSPAALYPPHHPLTSPHLTHIRREQQHQQHHHQQQQQQPVPACLSPSTVLNSALSDLRLASHPSTSQHPDPHQHDMQSTLDELMSPVPFGAPLPASMGSMAAAHNAPSSASGSPSSKRKNKKSAASHTAAAAAAGRSRSNSSSRSQSDEDDGGDDDSGNGDSVWSRDIEEAFEEALAIYPPCGRRKIIDSAEGKMYGRNELIARYIKLRTGKTRSRKQVSSHIQVLARKKQRELQTISKSNPGAQQAMASLAGLSSAEIVSSTMARPRVASMPQRSSSPIAGASVSAAAAASAAGYPPGSPSRRPASVNPGMASPMSYSSSVASMSSPHRMLAQQQQQQWLEQQRLEQQQQQEYQDAMMQQHYQQQQQQHMSSQHQLRLVMDHFSAYVEYPNGGHHELVAMTGSSQFADPTMEYVDILQIYDKFPGLRELYCHGPRHTFFLVKFWVDINFELVPDAAYATSCRLESLESMSVQCTNTIISMGKHVVERVQVELPVHDSGRFVYCFDRNELCPYMTQFIERLRSLDDRAMMNRVLENFSCVQTVTDSATGELLLCTAFVFEASQPGFGPRSHVYKLMDGHADLDPMVDRRFTA